MSAGSPAVHRALCLEEYGDLVQAHYFGTNLFAEEPGLSDAKKRDLIEFLKTR
jgi:hypothetical protein